MKKYLSASLLLLLVSHSGKYVFSLEIPPEKLPPILETMPTQPFQTLSTVGAGKKTIEEARVQTQREAIKVDADAIILLKCKEGHMRWQGLVFQKESAYCQGKAIQYLKTPPPTTP